MKMDWGLLLVIGGGIVSAVLMFLYGFWDAVYLLVACIVIDVFYRGIYQPLKEKQKMSSDLREWKERHTKENGF
jgi:hypothetical protein